MSHPMPAQAFAASLSARIMKEMAKGINDLLAQSPGWEPVSVSHTAYHFQTGWHERGKGKGADAIWEALYTAIIILRPTS